MSQKERNTDLQDLSISFNILKWFFMLVAFGFILKVLIVFSIGQTLLRRLPNIVERLLASWIIVHSIFVIFALLMSSFGRLSRPATWLLLVLGAIACFAMILRRRNAFQFSADALWSLPFTLLVAALIVRARYFQDFTLDAQTYGLVRQAVWLNTGSILSFADSPQVNVFANEWNGELVCFFYGLIGGDLQGPVMGGVEILVVTYLSALLLARQLSCHPAWQQATATIIAVTPSALGLALTVKGDLLAVAGLMMAVAWLIVYSRDQRRWAIGLCSASFGLAVGAKISVIFPAAVLLIAGMFLWRLAIFSREGAIGLAGAAVFLVRYALNAFQYGNPFERVATETAVISYATLLANLALVWNSVSSFVYHPGTPPYATHLTGGMGLTGYVALTGLIFVVVWRPRLLCLMAVVTAGTVAATAVLPSYPWSFRYFLPGIAVFATIAIGAMDVKYKTISFLVIGLSAVNSWYLVWPGELNGNGTFERAIAELPNIKDPIEKTFLAESTVRPIDVGGQLHLSRPEPLNIVVMQQINAAILPFQGGRAQHSLTFAADANHFCDLVVSRHPDVALFASPNIPHTLSTFLLEQGYELPPVAPGYLVGVVKGRFQASQ